MSEVESEEDSAASAGLRVSQHIYVPRHEILSKEQARNVLEKYSASPEQLPYLLNSDPMTKELAAKPGDIVAIYRRSETAGMSVYYRLVVEG